MISVVMPAYNASKFIAPAIESILNQTFQELELIIVDDGSTDNTLGLVNRYLEQDSRIRVVQSKHIGCSGARNVGVRAAKYPWIAVMDADDIALPERLEKQMEAVSANPQLVVCGTYAHHISATGEILSLQQQGPVTEEEFDNLRRAGEVPFVVHSTALFKKEICLQLGGYAEGFHPAEDFELFDRMGDYGLVLAIPEPLLLYRIHSQSASMQKFFLQQLLARCVIARHRTRLAGEEAPDLNQFIEAEKKQPIVSRVERQIRTFGQFWYRKAGLLFSEKQYLQAGLYLSLAIASNPSYSIPRLWKQKLSPQARRTLGESGRLGDRQQLA
jgi:glycosyltransferase involved in cell wall biosynthesis